MRYFFLILLLFLYSNSPAQERIVVNGLVKHVELGLENVHVKNVSSGKSSVSDAAGNFELSIKEGDTILLSHVGMNDLINFIEKKDLQQPLLIFKMTESSSELREVGVDENSEINAVSVGIIPKKKEKLSMNERRLHTAGDFKPIHLLDFPPSAGISCAFPVFLRDFI